MSIIPVMPRRILPVFALAAVAGVAVASAASASYSPYTYSGSVKATKLVAATPTCTTDQLVASSAPHPGGGAAGHYGVLLMFTNISKTACTISGFPDVAFLTGRSGTQINLPAQHMTWSTVAPVTLGQSTTAFATLEMVNTNMYPAEQCLPVASAGIRVTIPGIIGSNWYVSTENTVCSVNGVGLAQVSPVRAQF